MGKDKLRRFAEITAFDNVIELEDGKVLKEYDIFALVVPLL